MKSRKQIQEILIMTGTLSNLPPPVASYVEENYDHHRTPWVEGILEHIIRYFTATLGKKYAPLILTCTGHGAKEAIVANLVVPSDIVWASPDSDFAELAKRWGAQVTTLYSMNRPKIAFIDHVSPSGKIVNLENESKKIKKVHPRALQIVNISTSFGADSIDFAKVHVDGYIIVPECALMGIPGLSIVAVNRRVLRVIQNARHRMKEAPYTSDLLKYQESWEKNHTTPYSPNTSAAVALVKSLDLIESNGGIGAHIERHKAWASHLRTSLAAANIKPILHQGTSSTNAFTVFDLPQSISADKLMHTLAAQKNIFIEKFHARTNTIRVGHVGYLNSKLISRFLKSFSAALSSAEKSAGQMYPKKYSKVLSPILLAESRLQKFDLAETAPHATETRIFSIAPDEFRNQSIKKAAESGSPKVAKKIEGSAQKLFRFAPSVNTTVLPERIVGFIGAGNTVRWATEYCQKVGIKHLMVYSPSLAELKRKRIQANDASNHKTPMYWESRKIEIATSAKEIFLKAYTVVLLPTYYDKRALRLFQKPSVYLNKNIINGKLLREIKNYGKMDLLINSSAREGLIDRGALSRALKKGWLTYCSDEMPSYTDPLLQYNNAFFTGHVGGSCSPTLERIAQNTHTILRSIIGQMMNRKNIQSHASGSYTINLLNHHLKGSRPWRIELIGQNQNSGTQKIRVLLADKFDLQTLDFPSLEKLGVQITIRDISKHYPTYEVLKKHLEEFRPHIMMIRTRARITNDLMKIAKKVPELAVILRPGVGVDNMYNGMKLASKLGIQIINEPFGNSFAVGEMTLHFILNGTEKMMLTPGPSRFDPRVFRVMHGYQSPTSEKFIRTYKTTVRKLGTWMGSKNDPLILSGPSTAFMEAAISNLTSRGDRGLIISHGKFGERFGEIAEAKGRTAVWLKIEDKKWGKVFTPKEIKTFLRADAMKCSSRKWEKISFLCLQQNETSSGVAYSQSHITQIVRTARAYNPNMMIIVDAVSGLLSAPLDFDALDADAMIVGSQKSLGVASVITYIALSNRAIRKMLALAGFKGSLAAFLHDKEFEAYLYQFETKQKVHYLSLLRLLKHAHDGTFFDTPSIFHILSTEKSLDLLETEGGKEAVFQRHASLASLCRKEAKKMKLRLMSHAPYFSNSVTPIILPKGVSASELRKRLAELYGISIAGAQSDYWKDNMVRIGHVGYVYQNDIVRCMRALRIILKELRENRS